MIVRGVVAGGAGCCVLTIVVFVLFKKLAVRFGLCEGSGTVVYFLLSVGCLRGEGLVPCLLLGTLNYCFRVSTLLCLPLCFVLSHQVGVGLV